VVKDGSKSECDDARKIIEVIMFYIHLHCIFWYICSCRHYLFTYDCRKYWCDPLRGLWLKCLACWFILTLSRLGSEVKVNGQSLRSQEEQVSTVTEPLSHAVLHPLSCAQRWLLSAVNCEWSSVKLRWQQLTIGSWKALGIVGEDVKTVALPDTHRHFYSLLLTYG